MNIINFEGLGIYLKIKNVAINIFGVKVYWYGIVIISAIIIALFLSKRDDGRYNIKFEDVLQLMLFILPISIICARLYYIIFRFEHYIQNLSEIINIRNGGLAIYGGIIGAIITTVVFCKIKKIKILDILDYMAPYLALGQSIGRWGNFFNGEAHGTITNSLLRMGIVENGTYIQVHPTFLYESICTFLIFLFLLLKRKKRNFSGEITFWYFFLYGIVRAMIERLRTDSLMLGNYRVSQVLSIILSIIFSIILIYKKVKK